MERGEAVLDVELHGETPAAPGVPRDWVASYHPLRAADDTIVGVIGSVLEVTDRKRAEARLHEREAALAASEARLRAVLDAVPVGVFVAEADGSVPIINARAAEIFGGAPRAECLADYGAYRGYWTDTGVELRGEDWALARALVRGERSSGERIEVAAPLHDADGRIVGAVAAIVDVTAQVTAEAARQAELAARAAWFRAVFEQAPMALVVGRGRTLEELVFELVNPRWAEMLPPGRQTLGRRLLDALPELTPELRGVLSQVLASGQPALLGGLLQPLDRDGDGRLEDYHFNFAFHPLLDDDGAVAGIVAVGTEITDAVRARQEAEALAADLRASDERYALAARATRNVIRAWDLVGGTASWSAGAAERFGYASEVLDQPVDWWRAALHPEDRPRVLASVDAAVAGGETEWRSEYRLRRGDDSWASVVDRGYIVRDRDGRAVRMIGAMEDVTAQRQLEDRLRQAQKMEAVGQLAGGVAHDFNNLLTIITGNLEFLRADLPEWLAPDHPARQDATEIAQATDRARTLVQQLLTFSRKQPVHPRRLDLGELVRGTEKLLRRVIGEEITLGVQVAHADARVEADPGQLEQVLMNLAVNARDAMLTPRHGHDGRGGTLTLAVDLVTLAAPESRGWDGAAPGRWVRLRVRDTGHGMDAATQARAFEPFFTTKDVGAGTGLGLATVFGIVRKAGGVTRLDSAPGRGTTFTVLLPHAAPAEGERAPTPTVASRTVTATLLLVEDEPGVRVTTRRLLERSGYTVREAADGAQALRLWAECGDGIDAVVTDVRMPAFGGTELVARLRAERPALPVVFVSGYTDVDPLGVRAQPAGAGDAPPGHELFVHKPFTGEALLAAVAQVLASSRRP
jgi:PAS domain S-box-containing protein